MAVESAKNFAKSKLENCSTAIIFSVFDNHNIYFAFLFGFYGYFLVNSINLLRVRVVKISNIPIFVSFISFALVYSITTIYNYSFFTGAIYFLYFLLQIVLKEKNKKYFIFIFLTPLFHYGLTPLLLLPILYIIFGRRTKYYVLLLVLFSILSQSFLIDNLENRLSRTETVYSKRFELYGSIEGKERMDARYSMGYETGGSNYRLYYNIRYICNYFAIPLLLLFLFVNRRRFYENDYQIDLLHLSIASLAITNLMLNISQGERYAYISGFMILGTYTYYIQKKGFKTNRYKRILYVVIPIILLSNFVSLILIKYLVTSDTLFLNFPYLLYKSL